MVEAINKGTALDTATRILAARNLHQCLWLPRTEKHEKLRVTFSTTSNFDDQSCPPILFCGPMFGTRYLTLAFDKLARDAGVRVICVDRPGFGGSMQVPIDQRMNVWLEMVPVLLEHLGLQNVSLVSHSAGTMFLLNTLYSHRGILLPEAPYAAMIGPYVSPKYSKMTHLSAAAALPNSVISGWSPLVNFINKTITPVTSWSGGIFSSVSGAFQSDSGGMPDDTAAMDKYGASADTAKEIERLWGKFASAEQSMVGGNDEARLCLGRGPLGVCEDYMEYVKLLCAQEQQKQPQPQLKIQLCFAEDDSMIGQVGKEYIEKCWRQDCVRDSISIDSKAFPESNHETVLLDVQKGALRMVFEEIAAKASA